MNLKAKQCGWLADSDVDCTVCVLVDRLPQTTSNDHVVEGGSVWVSSSSYYVFFQPPILSHYSTLNRIASNLM